MISVAAGLVGLVGLACCVVDNRLVSAASVCVFACVYVTECVSEYIDPPGSDSLLCCSLVQFHMRVSQAAGQRLLLHCPEGMCVFDEFPHINAYVCVARRGS